MTNLIILQSVNIISTVMLKKGTKSKLVRIAADLQNKLGTRVDFDTAISFLIDQYLSGNQDWEKFDRFWKSEKKGKGKDLHQELLQERVADEEKYHRY